MKKKKQIDKYIKDKALKLYETIDNHGKPTLKSLQIKSQIKEIYPSLRKKMKQSDNR